MALEGNLNSFGLSEILQLISVQQKTGMLTVQSEHGNGVMFFRDGQLVSTRDRRRRARDPFKDYVTRYGILGREALMRVSQIASQSKLDFVDIVASEGLLDEVELEKHWRKQLQESMHDVLTWEQCSYKFISNEEIVQGIKTLENYSIEAMLMESMRRIDEFPQMLDQFPSDLTLISRLEPEDDEADASETDADQEEVPPANVATATPPPFHEAPEPGQVSLGGAMGEELEDPFGLNLDDDPSADEDGSGADPDEDRVDDQALEAKTDVLFDDDDDMGLAESLTGKKSDKRGKKKDVDMTQNEKDILALVVDTVSIRDLIARGKMPTFEVYEALKLLADKSLILVRNVEVASESDAVAPTRHRRRRTGPRNPLPFVAALVLFVGAAGVGLYRPATRVVSGDALQVTILQDGEMARTRLEHRLRWLIEAYRAENGTYPPNLDELVDANLAGKGLIEEAHAVGFRYRLTPGRAAYTLL
jgi:hypothetical protein